MTSIGDLILNEIIKSGLVRAEIINDSVLFTWQGNAAEQLEALVNNHLFTQPWKERIKGQRRIGEMVAALHIIRCSLDDENLTEMKLRLHEHLPQWQGWENE